MKLELKFTTYLKSVAALLCKFWLFNCTAFHSY